MKAVEEAKTRKWNPDIPLSEDIHLQAFPPLHDTQSILNFTPKDRPKLSQQQEVTVHVFTIAFKVLENAFIRVAQNNIFFRKINIPM